MELEVLMLSQWSIMLTSLFVLGRRLGKESQSLWMDFGLAY
jgi:hypothetical protein